MEYFVEIAIFYGILVGVSVIEVKKQLAAQRNLARRFEELYEGHHAQDEELKEITEQYNHISKEL